MNKTDYKILYYLTGALFLGTGGIFFYLLYNDTGSMWSYISLSFGSVVSIGLNYHFFAKEKQNNAALYRSQVGKILKVLLLLLVFLIFLLVFGRPSEYAAPFSPF